MKLSVSNYKDDTQIGVVGEGSQRWKGVLLLLIINASMLPAAEAGRRQRWYSGEDFGIVRMKAVTDYNENGKDDYLDLAEGARAYLAGDPDYCSDYCEGGYPPEGRGVCTDVIWQAFFQAGYDLKSMVDRDIRRHPAYYTAVKEADPAIDFRRVRVLKSFFDRYAEHLTLDPSRIEEWQPGDIVIYGDYSHIAIVSDRRTWRGKVWILHHGGNGFPYEESDLEIREIRRHYRFDASKIPQDCLIPWKPYKQ